MKSVVLRGRSGCHGRLEWYVQALGVRLNYSALCFGVRWPRFFLLFASRVLPSTPPLSQRVLRHFLLAQRVGFSTDGIQTWPQTSHTATFCIRQPMPEIIHYDHSAENSCVFP